MRQLGGLAIVGTERHESRRIDNQLRGRSGRQGDPGYSRFFISLDDMLMRRFAGDGMRRLMVTLGLRDGMAIESRAVSKRIEKAQTKVEEMNFGIRKNLLEYDEVMNLQRKQIYAVRQQILEGDGLEDIYWEKVSQGIDDVVQGAAEDGTRGEALAKRIAEAFQEATNLPAPAASAIPVRDGGDACRDALLEILREAFAVRKIEMGDIAEHALRFVLLESIDRRWTGHIDFMDQLRRGISLQAYGQKDPKLRFKEEGFIHFQKMHQLLRKDITGLFFMLHIEAPPEQPPGMDAALQAGGFAPRGIDAPAGAPMRHLPVRRLRPINPSLMILVRAAPACRTKTATAWSSRR